MASSDGNVVRIVIRVPPAWASTVTWTVNVGISASLSSNSRMALAGCARANATPAGLSIHLYESAGAPRYGIYER